MRYHTIHVIVLVLHPLNWFYFLKFYFKDTKLTILLRSAAAIATAVLEDFGVVNAFDTSNVIDPSKIRRECKTKRSQLKPSQGSKVVRGIYFDGRKDKTLENTKEGSKFYRR